MRPSGSTSWRSFTVSSKLVCAIDAFVKPGVDAGNAKFQGTETRIAMLVTGTTRYVVRRLAFMSSACNTTTGRRYPASEPTGSRKSASQISRCLTCTDVNHHSVCLSTVRAPARSHISCSWRISLVISSANRFAASVISLGLGLSSKASMTFTKAALRDVFQRRASASALTSVASGIDIATFIPWV